MFWVKYDVVVDDWKVINTFPLERLPIAWMIESTDLVGFNMLPMSLDGGGWRTDEEDWFSNEIMFLVSMFESS